MRSTSRLATSDVVLNAYNGTGKFADIGKLDNLRVIGAVYTSVLSGVALKSSGLTYIHELLGKRVAVRSCGLRDRERHPRRLWCHGH